MSKKCYRYFGGLLNTQAKWLNKMAEKGYRLVRTGKLLYEFEKCKPDEVTYCVEFIGEKSKENATDYAVFLEDMGYKVFFKNINLNYSVGKAYFTEHAVVVKADENNDTRFLYYMLDTMNLGQYSDQSAQPGLAVNKLVKLENQFPMKEEQQRIGWYFSNIDHLITLHQRKCEETKSLKKYMLQKMFPENGNCVPKIRFSGFADAWEQRKLKDYLEVSREKNKTESYGKEDVLSVSGEHGIVNQIEFQGRSFAGVSVANYGVVEAGDVVYTKSPLKSNPYGIIKTNKGKTGIVSTLYAVYKPRMNTNSEFVQIYFELDSRMNSYMHPLVNKGAKNDMKVSDENALKGPVAFPELEEQNAITQYFDKLDRLITLHQHKCDELQKLKKFMLQNMFTQKNK